MHGRMIDKNGDEGGAATVTDCVLVSDTGLCSPGG